MISGTKTRMLQSAAFTLAAATFSGQAAQAAVAGPSATTPTNITVTANGGICQISGTFDVTGRTADQTTSAGNVDFFQVRMTPGDPNSRIDRGDVDSVVVGQTETFTLTADLRESTVRISNLENSGANLEFMVFDSDTSRVLTPEIASAPVTDGQLRAAGGVCENIARIISANPNTAPVADAGTDQSVTIPPSGQTITLDATDSSDADGDTLTYQWTQTAGTAVTLDNPASSQPSFTVPASSADETLTFEVQVSDGVTSDTDTVNIDIDVNAAPTANAGADQTVAVPPENPTVTLDASLSSDPENDTLTYSWTQVSGPTVTLSDPSVVQPTFSLPTSIADRTQLVFRVSVSDGRSTVTDDVAITVDRDDAPTADAGSDISLDSPTDGQVVSLDGTGSSDPEGGALTYQWTQVAGRTLSISDATTATPDVTYTVPTGPLPARETVTFQLIVNDGTSDSVADTVVLTFVNNTAPLADAGADIADVNAGETVTLNAGGSSDPDGDTLSYSWTQVSGPAVTLSNANTATPSFVAPDVSGASDLVFRVTVSDGDLSATDDVRVGVLPLGSVTLVQLSDGGDVLVTYSSTLSALSGSLQSIDGRAERIATRIARGSYTLTASDARDAGFALTDLSCSDTDSTVDLASRTANIALSPGEDLVCTFTTTNSRGAAREAINRYLGARNALLLSNEPDRQRRLDRLNGVSASGSVSAGGLQVASGRNVPVKLAMNDDKAAFSTSLSAMSGAAGGKGDRPGSVDVWVEGVIADVDLDGRDGEFSVIHGGVDRRVGENLLIGAMVSVDSFDLNGDAPGLGRGDVEGDGWLAGPYVTARVADGLYLDGRVAYGQSDNEVNPLGTFVDSFDTSRWLTNLSVIGEMDLSRQLLFSPAVSFRYIEETQEEYTDSLGVVIGDNTVAQGEISFAPRLSGHIALGTESGLRPYAEVEGIYSFGNEVEDVLGSETRLRAEAGADVFTGSGLRGSLAVFADGIGSDDFEATGARFRISYAFK